MVGKINGTVEVGLIGSGIQTSRSPALHMEEAKSLGIDLRYNLIDLDFIEDGANALGRLLKEVQDKGYLGVNITHPCKQAVIPFLDELSPDAKALGAVNTVVFRDGQRIGHNTDWFGYYESFRRSFFDVAIENVVQLGAGGAGAAVAYALMKLGTRHLTIFELDPKRGREAVDRLNGIFEGSRVQLGGNLTEAIKKTDGLVNCTPIGMDSHPGLPLPEPLLRPDLWVSEVVYFPLETELLKKAKALGCRTLNGSAMNIFQGAQALELFIGVKPDLDRMLNRYADSYS
jgi:quinate/shikimate dehydrogenase (NAD+)